MRKIRRRFIPGLFALRVGRSRTGRGIFAQENIPKGACLLEYKGRPVSDDEQFTHRGRYLFETSKTTMIDGNIKGNTAKYVNHSCAPNCEIDIHNKRVYIFARRAIRAGEELTYDYDTEYFEAYIKPRGCKCIACEKKNAL